MAMIEPIQIGLVEVYAAVQRVESKVDTMGNTSSLIDYRLTQLESDKAKRWQLHLALLAAFVAIAVGVLSIILK